MPVTDICLAASENATAMNGMKQTVALPHTQGREAVVHGMSAGE